MSATRARTVKKSKVKARRVKKPKVYNQDRYIIPALRKIWRFYPIRSKVKKEAADGRGFYKCAICKGSFEEVQVDHIDPVGTCKRPDGKTDYNRYIDRLLCSEDNLQVVCTSCHKIKSQRETTKRKKARESK